MATKDSCDLKSDSDKSERWRTDDKHQIAPPPLPKHLREAEDFLRHDGAPPVVQTSLVQTPLVPTSGEFQPAEKKPQSIDDFLKNVANVHPDHASHAKRDSAGWMTSVTVHGLILALFYLLLAPADMGGIDMQVLYFSFADAETEEQDEGVKVEVVEIEPEPEEPATPVVEPPPAVVVPQSTVAKSEAAADGEAFRDGAMPGGNAGSSGSFFGIEASGRDFVYVVDMSGSMRGRRYRRATAELVRSVEGLRPTQNFYVLLFNGGTVKMFNDSSRLRPEPIPATPENKSRLARWVQTAFKGGSTDPREALHIALRMKPSAVFMLSDGEFDDQKTTKSNILRGNPDAFSIVRAAAANVPINAIAFEDPSSCRNMQRLAEMTNGEYHFAKKQDIEQAKRTMKLAQLASDGGDKATAKKLLRDVILRYGHTDAGREARRKIVPLFAEGAETAAQAGNVTELKEALMDIISADQQGEFSWDVQDGIVADLMLSSNERANNALFAEIVDRFPGSKMAQLVIDQAAKGLLAHARQLRGVGDAVASLKTMDTILKKYTDTPAAKECRVERDKLTSNLMAKAKQLHEATNDAAYAKLLRGLSEKFAGTCMEPVAQQALDDLLLEMLAKVRDASIRRDFSAKNELNRMINEGFAGHAKVDEIRKEFSRGEIKARDLYRRAEKLERISKLDHAQTVYAQIVENYPATLSAAKAKRRIRSLTRDTAADDEDLSELMQMMDQ